MFRLLPIFRSKIQIEILELQLLAYLVIPDADRCRGAVYKAYRRMGNGCRIQPADIGKAAIALFVNRGEHHADGIHMRREHQLFPLTANSGNHIAMASVWV